MNPTEHEKQIADESAQRIWTIRGVIAKASGPYSVHGIPWLRSEILAAITASKQENASVESHSSEMHHNHKKCRIRNPPTAKQDISQFVSPCWNVPLSGSCGKTIREEQAVPAVRKQESAPAAEQEVMPCPFCGKLPMLTSFPWKGAHISHTLVRCETQNCPASRFPASDWETWNTRTPSPAPEKPVAALEEIAFSIIGELSEEGLLIRFEEAPDVVTRAKTVILAALASAPSPSATTR